MAEVVYVRNTRPNAVLLRPAGVTAPITVERRGSREDTAAIPGDWLNDPAIDLTFRKGMIERISKEAFLALGERREGRPAYALKKSANDVELPMAGEDTRTPTVMADKTIDTSKHLRSPHPEFAERVLSTDEEIATGVRQPLVPEVKNMIPATREEKLEHEVGDLKEQISALTGLVTQLVSQQSQSGTVVEDDVSGWDSDEEVEAPKPRAKKSSTSKTKSATKRS